MDRRSWWAIVLGIARVTHDWAYTHTHTHTTQGVDVSKEISLLFKWKSYLIFHLTEQRLLTVRSTRQSLE